MTGSSQPACASALTPPARVPHTIRPLSHRLARFVPGSLLLLLLIALAAGCTQSRPTELAALAQRSRQADELRRQAQYAQAEVAYRAVVSDRQRVLGPDHPETLQSRSALACVLRAQGRYAEAEAEYRAVLALRERVLGPDHYDVCGSCFTLALLLNREPKNPEALVLARRAWQGWHKTLGDAHADTQDARKLLDILEQPQ